VARSGAFAAIILCLPRTDGRPRDLAHNRGKNDIAHQVNAAFFERLAGHHECRHAAFHVGDSEALHFAADDLAFELAFRLHFRDHARVFRGPGEARVRVAIETQTQAASIALDDTDGIWPIELDVLPHRFNTIGFVPVENKFGDGLFLARRTWDAG
jgi:hypothetical protein